MSNTDSKTRIDPLSVTALHVVPLVNNVELSSATAFTVRHDGQLYLVTNWHVVSGRHPDTQDPLSPTGGLPDQLAVFQNAKGKVGSWIVKKYALYDSDNKHLWKEMMLPSGSVVDVVVLAISEEADVEIYALDLGLTDTDMIVGPSEPVSIVGFPYGRASNGKAAIWKTGHVASDIDLEADGKPAFFVDANTKSGMSGSPVVARRVGMFSTSQAALNAGSATRFMGIYSGRIKDEEQVQNWNLGLVWKPHVLKKLLES